MQPDIRDGELIKHAGGRPTKYEERFGDEVIEFLKDGYSVAAFAGHIGVSYSTVKLWMQEHPEFSASVKIASARSVLWWEERNRAIAQGQDGNATSVIFGLKNRAPEEWRDKTEQEHSGVIGVQRVERVIVDPNPKPSDS
jgi:hypothetical protein